MKTKRILFMLVGILQIGVGVGLFRRAALGADPYSCLNAGLAGVLPFSFGTTQLIVNLLLLAMQFFFLRGSIGPGTVINLITVGYIADGVVYLLRFTPEVWPMAARVAVVAVCVVNAGLGVSLYATSNLGIAPYDAVATVLATKTRLAFRWCRVLGDATCVLIGFVLGSTVGIGTLATAAGTGPLIHFFNKKVAEPLLGKAE